MPVKLTFAEIFERRNAEKLEAIREKTRMLISLKHDLRKTSGRSPVAVMLPEELNPGKYDGPDATDYPGSLMGLPIVWGKTTGLVYGI